MIASIDPTRAARARAIYDTALNPPAVILSPEDAAEWQALEAKGYDFEFDGKNCGVKHSNVPHKRSAYASLPMRGITYGQGVGTTLTAKRRAEALWPELKRTPFRSLVSGKIIKDHKPKIGATGPHPDSYGADLPMHGLGLGLNPKGKDGQFQPQLFDKHDVPPTTRFYTRKQSATHKWALSAAEKRELAARPLVYVA